jgi:hypothetical protein
MDAREQCQQAVEQLPASLAQEMLDVLLSVRNRHNGAWLVNINILP